MTQPIDIGLDEPSAEELLFDAYFAVERGFRNIGLAEAVLALHRYTDLFVAVQLERVAAELDAEASYSVARKVRSRAAKFKES